MELSREIVRRFNFYYFKIDPALFQGRYPPVHYVIAKLLGSSVASGAALSDSEKLAMEKLVRQTVTEGQEETTYPQASEQIGIREFLETNSSGRASIFTRGSAASPSTCSRKPPAFPASTAAKCPRVTATSSPSANPTTSIRTKTKVMMTDPARKRRTDPGNPDVCPVYDWHKLFSPPRDAGMVSHGCRTAGHRLHRVQGRDGRPLDQVDRAGTRAPPRIRKASEARARSNRRRLKTRPSRSAKTMARVREAVFGWQKKRTEVSGSL